jgi:mono/diheme cytochrome c family protein
MLRACAALVAHEAGEANCGLMKAKRTIADVCSTMHRAQALGGTMFSKSLPLVIAAVIACAVIAAHAQENSPEGAGKETLALPEGPGKETVAAVCGGCHGINVIRGG